MYEVIGWEPNLTRSGITTIFAIPKQERPQVSSQTGPVEILGEDFTHFRERNESLDLRGRSLESFFVSHTEPRLAGGPHLLQVLEDSHRCLRGNLFTTVGAI